MIVGVRRRRVLWCFVVVVVACRVFAAAWYALEDRVPHCVGDAARQLVVELLRVDAVDASRARLHARVVDDRVPDCVNLAGKRLRLNWYYPPGLAVGDEWQVTAVVRSPWGYQNPGGFDYERWLMSEGLNGTGYVREGRLIRSAPPRLVDRYRTWVVEQLGQLQHRGYLLALATGQSDLMTDQDWNTLRRTGTVHLLVISGLHVGLVAVFGYTLGLVVARLVPGMGLWMTATHVAAATSILCATSFTWMSGMQVPAVRACLMAACAAIVLTLGRTVPAHGWWLAAVACVLGVYPLSIFDQGFWLSFGAVLVLIVGLANRVPRPGRAAGLIRAQSLMLLGMTPLVAVVVGEISTIAGPANLVAVPLLSIVVVPFVLLGLVASTVDFELGLLAWRAADAMLSLLFNYLALLESFDTRAVDGGTWLGAASVLGIAMLLAAPDWRAVVSVVPLWATWMIIDLTSVPPGEVRVTALDVGQGSAALIDTTSHRLLFDAGARFPSGFDLGAAVVVPAIGVTGFNRLDKLVVSHGDNDHAGGAQAVSARVPTLEFITTGTNAASVPCVKGQRWVWDGVRFEFLHPKLRRGNAGERADNDSSCVLLVTAGKRHVLLTGDIGRLVEIGLAAELPSPITVLFAPHHGSATSSSRRFVTATEPRVVIVSAGFKNRYGHPRPDVVARYLAVGAEIWITGRDGALIWESQHPLNVKAWRHTRRAWWVNRPPHDP